jgi:glyoxylase-like metal-dependent hydrolase (beta-lactamase superfamily II)
MHGADVAYLAQLAHANGVPGYEDAMRIAGVPREFALNIERSLRGNRPAFRTHHPDLTLKGGETLAIRGGALEIVWTPGHTPGHVCLYWPQERTLISGDHVLQKITPNIAWHPGEDMLAQYLASLELLLPYDVGAVIPSHGTRFEDHRGVIAKTIQHHQERCTMIRDRILKAPMTTHELVLSIWNRTLSSFHHHFAVFEILAHLEYMARLGEVLSRRQADGALKWEPQQ